MNFTLTFHSKNSKTGNIPVGMSDSKTCPDSCSFKKSNSCYAKFNFLGAHWKKLDNGKIGTSFGVFVNNIKKLPQTIWRFTQAGDLPGVNNKINFKMLKRVVKANQNRPVIVYTHKLVLGDSKTAQKNRKYIEFANKNGFLVNLSADGVIDADKKSDLNIGPVCVVLPENSPNKLFTPKGRKIVVCPAQYRDLTCKDCMLCSKPRSVIIGFKSHGTGKKIVNKLVK